MEKPLYKWSDLDSLIASGEGLTHPDPCLFQEWLPTLLFQASIYMMEIIHLIGNLHLIINNVANLCLMSVSGNI